MFLNLKGANPLPKRKRHTLRVPVGDVRHPTTVAAKNGDGARSRKKRNKGKKRHLVATSASGCSLHHRAARSDCTVSASMNKAKPQRGDEALTASMRPHRTRRRKAPSLIPHALAARAMENKGRSCCVAVSAMRRGEGVTSSTPDALCVRASHREAWAPSVLPTRCFQPQPKKARQPQAALWRMGTLLS